MNKPEMFDLLIRREGDIWGSIFSIFKGIAPAQFRGKQLFTKTCSRKIGKTSVVIRTVISSTTYNEMLLISKLRVQFVIDSIDGHKFGHCFARIQGLTYDESCSYLDGREAVLKNLSVKEGGDHGA